MKIKFFSAAYEELVNTIYRQKKMKEKIQESFKRIKNAFKKMQEKYDECERLSLFAKYVRLQQMISEVNILL